MPGPGVVGSNAFIMNATVQLSSSLIRPAHHSRPRSDATRTRPSLYSVYVNVIAPPRNGRRTLCDPITVVINALAFRRAMALHELTSCPCRGNRTTTGLLPSHDRVRCVARRARRLARLPAPLVARPVHDPHPRGTHATRQTRGQDHCRDHSPDPHHAATIRTPTSRWSLITRRPQVPSPLL